MKIDKSFPMPQELFKNEICTLSFLRDQPFWSDNYRQLSEDAKNFILRNYEPIKKAKLCKIDFESYFEIIIDNEVGTAYVGVRITKEGKNTYGELSYHFAIWHNNNPKILRKFHFDYTANNISGRQLHPIFHLQYPGEPSDNLKGYGVNYDHLDCWLSEPRLPYAPMSLALLLNLILKEFPQGAASKAIGRSEWRSLIKKNETLLLKPYYENCHKFISRRDGLSLLSTDYFYGQQ